MSRQELYELTWPGKRESIIEAGRPTDKTLRPCVEESKNFDETQNLYIEGDNLEALKILQKSCMKRIKMIYIDPPYNTGHDFIYRDDYSQSEFESQEDFDLFDEESGEKNFTFRNYRENTRTNPRFHSDWLSMIYPRLKLARNLLADDGVIFISIDDNEAANLRKVCDEIFGEENFLVQLIWNKQHSQQQGIFKKYHEYVIAYAINASIHENIRGGEGVIEAGAQKKISKLNPESTFKFPAGVRFEAKDGTCFTGTYGDAEKTTVVEGRLIAQDGKTAEPVTLSAGWTQKNQMALYFAGEEVYDTKGQKVLEFFFNSRGKIKYLKERSKITPPSILPLYGMVSETSSALAKLMGGNYFDTPKPVNMIKDFVQWFTNEDSIILDFFAGSSTTAHAVMKLNHEDGGSRKFIMIQLPEECSESSEAFKAGFHTICEIGRERIRRAGESLSGDTGFRVMKVDSGNYRDVFFTPEELTQDWENMLDDAIENIKTDRSGLDLLFGTIAELGLPLSLKYSCESVKGFHVHCYGGNEIIACFDSGLDGELVKFMAQKQPKVILFRDSCFEDSNVMINLEQIIRFYAPDSEIKIL